MASEERRIDRWARSVWASGTPSGVEHRVLLESPRATQPRFWKTPLGVVLMMVLTFSGIAGAAALLSSPDLTAWRRGFDAEQALVLAGVCFALSTVFVVVLAVDWVRQGRERGPAAGALFTMVPAGVALLFLRGDNALDPGSVWAAPVWIAAALSALLFLVVLVASAPAQQKEKTQGPHHPLDIESLTPTEVAQLLDLRHRTLQTLADRELLAPEIVDRARDVPLGELHTLDDEAEALKPET